MFSKTKTGPVEPKMVSGCPEAIPQTTPHRKPEQRDSMVPKRFSVASPSRPPNVMMGVKQAKYMNVKAARH